MTMNNNYICLNTDKTTKIKQILCSWFNNYNPQYFLSIQLPGYLRSTDLDKTQKNLHKIMSTFEKILLGRHWNRKHIPFFIVAERGKSINWHYHALIYECPFNFFEIQMVFSMVSTQLNLPHEVLYIEPVNNDGAYSYTSKEFKANINYHFDSDRIITSEILFNLTYKPLNPTRESQRYIPGQQNFNF